MAGYTRAYGARLPSGERREWIKPIMFSGGFGQIDRAHHKKNPPEVGMLVVKVGGPAYRIGMGGGAASSVPSGSSGKAELDFNAVQRGDAEMSQKLWRVVRACVEMGDANPIVQVRSARREALALRAKQRLHAAWLRSEAQPRAADSRPGCGRQLQRRQGDHLPVGCRNQRAQSQAR